MQIAIDGPAGAGKSTIAKALARELGLLYLDTGAMYRAVGWAALGAQVDLDDGPALEKLMDRMELRVQRRDGEQRMLVRGEDVTGALRTPEVSMAASRVSRQRAVRQRLVALQQKLAQGQDVVMDGRDIGTHVLPQADYKFFLTASDTERARRRCVEMQSRGESVDEEQILQEIRLRDKQDSTRAESPLVMAADAVRVDTDGLNAKEVLQCLLTLLGRA